jgi:hypothetical protein
MALPNVTINLANGALGRASASADGVAGLVLTGVSEGNITLNTAVQLASSRDLVNLGVTEANNPLAVKEVNAFYKEAGDGAELYLIIVPAATLLTTMCDMSGTSALRKLIEGANRRIRLVGVNRRPPVGYTADTKDFGIDEDAVTAASNAQALAESFTAQVNPFRIFMPGICWDGTTANLFQPRESSTNRVAFVLSSDAKFDGFASPCIGQVLGRAAAIAVNLSIARVKDGAIQVGNAYWADGSDYPVHAGKADLLNDAGYIFYRTFIAKNGYYLNDDPMAAPLTDDYSSLNLGRVIDKAIIQAYTAYIDEIGDNVKVDADGKIPQAICTYFEKRIENAVAVTMAGEISDFKAFIDPNQNILSTSRMDVVCRITPTGILRQIVVNLGFQNPAISN